MNNQSEMELTEEQIKEASMKVADALNGDALALRILEGIDDHAQEMVDRHVVLVHHMDELVSNLDVPEWDAVRTVAGMMDSYFDEIKRAVLDEMAKEERWSEAVANYKTNLLISQMLELAKNAGIDLNMLEDQEEVIPPKSKMH